jgi:hypothetical protein
MRRILLMLSVAALMASMMIMGAGSALADAPRNQHNCNGAATSTLAPPTNLGAPYGQLIKEVADTQGEFQQDTTDQSANCGANPR